MSAPTPSENVAMEHPIPTNETVENYGDAIYWRDIEEHKRRFNQAIKTLTATTQDNHFPLEEIADAVGIPLTTVYPENTHGNVILGHENGQTFVLGSFVSERFRFGKTLLQSIVPYNFNPAVNHTNLHETENPKTKMRAMGAELELGLFYKDGTTPDEASVREFTDIYRNHAHRLGITPQVDREACQYQVEVHVAPGVGYTRVRQSLDGIMQSLVMASQATNLNTAVLAAYPIESDFKLTDDPKVYSATDVMQSINSRFPEYLEKLETTKKRYHMTDDTNFVQAFRLQGCHIHLDIAGRSEALGLFTFYTMLRSATAIANAAMLKGSPFVNGTCDPEYICTREYLRRTTVTGRMIEMPLSPHLIPDGLNRYAELIHSERANAVARGLLCEDGLGTDISAMHNPIGRIRPDLGMSKRICTIESTGMPVNISASRQAAVLADFEFTHVLIENYYRQYGMDLGPMMDDQTLWEIVGPLSMEKYAELQEDSDREGTDIIVETAAGRRMSLAEFYEMKRMYMHRILIDVDMIAPRDIDDVYMSLSRMLVPPSGRIAETIHQYIADPKTRSTGNWGKILRNAFIEAGGTPGSHNPEAVLKVANQVHEALVLRYS
ncbi:hypothetical protein G4Y79_11730 [Phototrophicus methaneseepsis]|uniref:Uncharacterized protein n=1 Tax=Phototrophicus methaneseepsis TaxID=2710758 RepID=A0A7S8IH43_9CHLR|nr:hypothetical protein [Phototrophicus methaneseepsis]QPC85003.1 hypothetical protein G4Y79_11730 [Phototrophicus methaneseepsis]